MAYGLAIEMIDILAKFELQKLASMKKWISGQPLVKLEVTLGQVVSVERAITCVREHMIGETADFFRVHCQFLASYSRYGLPKTLVPRNTNPNDGVGFYCFLKNEDLTEKAHGQREEDHTSFKGKLVKDNNTLITREQFDSMFKKTIKLIPDSIKGAGDVKYAITRCETAMNKSNADVLGSCVSSLRGCVREVGGSEELVNKLTALAKSARQCASLKEQ